MFGRLFYKWALRGSEGHIKNFLELFNETNNETNGVVLAWAAIIHYQIMTQDPEFERLLNSKKGEYKGIATYILKLNRIAKKIGSKTIPNDDEIGGILLWNITFRCMSDESLHHYGESLWKTASHSFAKAKYWLNTWLENAKKEGFEQKIEIINGALKLYNFIPPQFRVVDSK